MLCTEPYRDYLCVQHPCQHLMLMVLHRIRRALMLNAGEDLTLAGKMVHAMIKSVPDMSLATSSTQFPRLGEMTPSCWQHF